MLLKLWGDDSFFHSRNLDVYITKLRDYLKEDNPLRSLPSKVWGTNLKGDDMRNVNGRCSAINTVPIQHNIGILNEIVTSEPLAEFGAIAVLI